MIDIWLSLALLLSPMLVIFMCFYHFMILFLLGFILTFCRFTETNTFQINTTLIQSWTMPVYFYINMLPSFELGKSHIRLVQLR